MTDLNSDILNACADLGVNLDPDTSVPASNGKSGDTAPLLDGLLSGASAYHRDIPAREWLVDGLLPVGGVTLFTGRGGVGKTLLAQQIATCIASGKDVLGRPCTQAPVLGLYGEDDTDELSRRQQCIMHVHNIDPERVEDYHFKSLFGQETLLGSFNKTTAAFEPSPLYKSIRATALALGARLIILDNATQMYAGDVNDRGPVTRFLQHLNRLALDINGAVLLLGHVAKAEESAYVGSTAWQAGVRQQYQILRKEMPGATLDPYKHDYRTLKVVKSNYGGIGDDLQLRYDRGAFVEVEGQANDFHRASDPQGEREFLEYLDLLAEEQIAVSASKRAVNFAPKVMKATFRQANSQRMEAAMTALLQRGELVEDAELGWERAGRKKATGLARPKPPTPAEKRANDIMDLIRAKVSVSA